MIPMVMALIQGGTALASGGMQLAAGQAQQRALKRQTRFQVAQLESNADISSQKQGFDQSRIQDQVDASIARQQNYFASGNIDFTSGSPAILAAQSEAIGMQDQMLTAARGQQDRADIYGQIAGIRGKMDDARKANSMNVASTILNTVGKLASIASGQMQPGSTSNADASGAGFNAPGPLDVRPSGMKLSGTSSSFSATPWGLY